MEIRIPVIGAGHMRCLLGIALLIATTRVTAAEPLDSTEGDGVGAEATDEDSTGAESYGPRRPKGHDGLIADSEPLGDGPWADGVSLKNQRRAYALFIEGNALMKDAFPAKASVQYLEALAIWEHPAVYFNLAMAQRLLDKPVAAHRSLRRAMRHGEGPIGAQKYLHAQRTLETLESTLGRIEIISPEAEAQVTIDGKVVLEGAGKTDVVVRVGSHQVSASKPGRIPFAESVEVSAGEIVRVMPELRFDSRLETQRRWARWVPYSVAGASAIVFAGAALLESRSASRFDEYDRRFKELCPTGCQQNLLPDEVTDIEGRAETLRTGAIMTYTLGTAVLASAAVLLYMNRAQKVEVSYEYDETEPRLSITPSVSDGAVTGITIETSFSF